MARHALIVEPDAARAAQYSDLLERKGLVPAVAQRGDEALFIASRMRSVALFVLESALPDLDGLAALRELRMALRPAVSPAIVLVGTRAAYDQTARLMIPLGIAALLPRSHTLATLEKAIDRALSSNWAACAPQAQNDEPPPGWEKTDPPERVASHPLVQHLARMPGLLAGSDEDLQRVVTGTARAFGAAIGLLWLDMGERSTFHLHMEDAVPARSPLRVPARWQSVRALVDPAPIYLPDVAEHPAFAREPLLPDGASASLIGAPLWRGTDRVGALAVVQPRVVGHLGRGLVDALVFWSQRLSGDLLDLPIKSPRRRPLLEPPPCSPVPPPQALENIAAVLDLGLLGTDSSGIVCYASPAMVALLGTERRHLLGQTRALALRRLATAAGAEDAVVTAIVGASGSEPQEGEFGIERPQQRMIRWRTRPLELPGQTGRLDEFTNVTSELDGARTRETLVRIDDLTHLPNRAGIEDALFREVARSLRTGEPVSIALFALDNPHLGDGGQDLLRRVASLLRSTARRQDVVGRLDRLRLLVVLTATRGDEARRFCERFAAELRCLEAPAARSTVSAGVAQFDTARTVQEVIQEATTRLSEARRLGGDRVA
jgi:diguanylate cyclase (GGDEF)-like protein